MNANDTQVKGILSRFRWKPLIGYEERYIISVYGDVVNRKTGRLLKPSKTKKGYLQVSLSKNGIKKTHKIHMLVFDTMHGPGRDSSWHIDHIDNDNTNNYIKNLQLIPAHENIMKRHGKLNKVYSK